jgi:hypothetical protein
LYISAVLTIHAGLKESLELGTDSIEDEIEEIAVSITNKPSLCDDSFRFPANFHLHFNPKNPDNEPTKKIIYSALMLRRFIRGTDDIDDTKALVMLACEFRKKLGSYDEFNINDFVTFANNYARKGCKISADDLRNAVEVLPSEQKSNLLELFKIL